MPYGEKTTRYRLASDFVELFHYCCVFPSAIAWQRRVINIHIGLRPDSH